ncbi:MAG: type II toxin-antitoxin system RelE/ParE family toxin [Verrucomicrobiales bacterium]
MDKPRKIQWTERASSDLESLIRYLKRRDPEAAGRIGTGIYQKVRILLEYPEIGGYLDELREQGWRKLTFRRWKVIYTYREGVIIIGRVWPAAMGDANLDTPLPSEDD